MLEYPIKNVHVLKSLKLANSADPGQMPYSVVFHLGFIALGRTTLGVSSIQKVKTLSACQNSNEVRLLKYK